MKKWMMLMAATMTMSLTVPAFAQDVEEDGEGACKDAAAAAAKDTAQTYGKDILAAHSKMVNACAAFRQCKKTCRQDKRSCKEDARSDKGQCIADCGKISDKKKEKACKQGCRADKKADKKECRQDKRACKTQCVAEEKQGPCKAARKEFWGLVGKASGSLARDINKACGPEFTQE